MNCEMCEMSIDTTDKYYVYLDLMTDETVYGCDDFHCGCEFDGGNYDIVDVIN